MGAMKTIILAGGAGTRLAEETVVRPKPMVEIGGRPLLWHILSIFAAHGQRDFIVACGYKGELIKEFFTRFAWHAGDIVVDMKTGKVTVESNRSPDWRVAMVDTGLGTQTGGRLLRLKSRVHSGTFMIALWDRAMASTANFVSLRVDNSMRSQTPASPLGSSPQG